MQSEAKRMKSLGLSHKTDLHPALAAKVQVNPAREALDWSVSLPTSIQMCKFESDGPNKKNSGEG